MFIKKFLYISLLFLLLLSCNNNNDFKKLDTAEAIMETFPDSAMSIIHAVRKPEKNNEALFMRYSVLNTLAKYKTYKDIHLDTAVFEAVRYFEKAGDLKYKSLAAYVAGAVSQERNQNKEAIYYFKLALNEGKNLNDDLLKAKLNEHISYLYAKQYLYKDAIYYEKKAIEYFSKLPNYEGALIRGLITLGNYYVYTQKLDSALLIQKQSHNLALKIKDTDKQALSENALANIYKLRGDYSLSARYLKAALLKVKDNGLKSTYMMNIVSVYTLSGQTDSAAHYINTIQESIQNSNDLNYQATVTELLKDYYKLKDSGKALNYLEKNRDILNKIFFENQSKALIEAEKKFDYTIHIAEAEKAKLSQRITVLVFIGVLLILLLLGLEIRNKFKQQQLVLEMERKTLAFKKDQQEKENKNLENELGRFKYMTLTLQNILVKTNALHAEINNIVQAGILHEKSERHEKIKLKLKETQETVKENISFNAQSFLTDRLLLPENILKHLNEEEIIILTMLYYKESRKDIAGILSISPQAVYNRIPRLKSKLDQLGVEPKTLDIFFEKENLS